MKSNPSGVRARVYLAATIAALILLSISPVRFSPLTEVSAQGAGGRVQPTPVPKKTPPKKTTPAPRVNRRSNPNAQPREDAAATERTYWETIRSSTDPEDFRAYLKKYPEGQFADLAKNRIRALETPKPQPSPSPTPAPTPEIAYEWTKAERDLPAPVQLERGEEGKLSFSVPSGWTRSKREEGRHYLQVNFRAPDSPHTNISVLLYARGVPVSLPNGSADVYRSDQEFIAVRRNDYAVQTVSAKLTDREVINHPTGRWYTFTADVLDGPTLYGLFMKLGAVIPDNIWERRESCNYCPGGYRYEIPPGSLSTFNRTRHSYAIKGASATSFGEILVVLYTAPIDKFDDKLLPSIMATMKMSGGKIMVGAASSDSSVSLHKYEPEIMIDGERKGADRANAPVNAGKHRVTVRAKEHKPFEKDVFVGGWEELNMEVKLERIPSSTGGATPK